MWEKRKYLVVLEDDARRIRAMQSALQTAEIDFDVRWFDHAGDFCAWIQQNLEDTVGVSLDHDLDSIVGNVDEPGDGSDVVEWLVSQGIKLPVCIHSSNATAAPAMHLQLALAGWNDLVLAPFADAAQWIVDIRKLLKA